MHLILIHASNVPGQAISWFKILASDEKKNPRLLTADEKKFIKQLQPSIEAMAQTKLKNWYRQAEFNPRTGTLELAFTTGVAGNEATKHTFGDFKGWLAIFSEAPGFKTEASDPERAGSLE